MQYMWENRSLANSLRQKIDKNKAIKAIDHIYIARVHNDSTRTPRIKVKLQYPNGETLVHAIPDTGAEVNDGGTKLLDQLQLCERDLRVAMNHTESYSLLMDHYWRNYGTLPITITLNETSIKNDIVICERQNDLLLSWKTCRDLAIIPDNLTK